MILNCVTIDDEPLARGLINSFVEVTPFLQLTASFSSATQALRSTEIRQAQLVFLDIQMPKMNGIEIARIFQQLPEKERPRVIFTTAYNQFAVESYQVDAVDYLLKPFEYEDFLNASKKAQMYYQQQLAPQPKAKPTNEECIFVRVDYQLIRINWDDIRYIEGLKDYVKIYLIGSDKPIITLATLKSLTKKLPPERFMRVQRSFIVALDKIRAIGKNSIWIDEVEITIGENYKETLQLLMGKWL